MERYIYNQENSLWYELHGDVYLPCISPAEDNVRTIGKWGRLYLAYIREHKRVLYTNLLTTGKLNSHLSEIDSCANRMYEDLMKALPDREKITEDLKAEKPMEWVRCMNNLRNRVEEIVKNEVIYA